MLKVHFVIWYQSHFESILASVCVGPIVPPAIGPPIIYSLTLSPQSLHFRDFLQTSLRLLFNESIFIVR